MPVVLCILDGWGVGKKDQYNAIYKASTPNYDFLLSKFPSCLVDASGLDVGLPSGQMGPQIIHLCMAPLAIAFHLQLDK